MQTLLNNTKVIFSLTFKMIIYTELLYLVVTRDKVFHKHTWFITEHISCWFTCNCRFLARLHFSAEELLLHQTLASACKMLGQMLKSWNFSLSVFFLHFNLSYYTNKAPFNKSSRPARIRWLWHLWCNITLQVCFRGHHCLNGISFSIFKIKINPCREDVNLKCYRNISILCHNGQQFSALLLRNIMIRLPGPVAWLPFSHDRLIYRLSFNGALQINFVKIEVNDCY